MIVSMTPAPPPITPEQLATLSPALRMIVRGLIEHDETRIAPLEAELAEAKKTPRNSSLPPSAEHPHAKPSARRPASKKTRGGQPGHAKHQRALIPVTQCDELITLRPDACRCCGGPLQGDDPRPLRHQVWDVPPIRPHVTEYRRHRLRCAGCGRRICGALPTGVPTGTAGPRLVALSALLMGCFRQSKRRVALFLEQVLGQPCSPGWVVTLQDRATAALQPAFEEVAAALPSQPVLGIDETPTRQAAGKAWLWTFVAPRFTLFTIRPTRAATVLTERLTDRFDGVVVCDRAKMDWSRVRLQWCWAHHKRDIQALIDHDDGQVRRLGHDLMRQTESLFRRCGERRDGTLSPADWKRRMGPIRHSSEGSPKDLLDGARPPEFEGGPRIERPLPEGRRGCHTRNEPCGQVGAGPVAPAVAPINAEGAPTDATPPARSRRQWPMVGPARPARRGRLRRGIDDHRPVERPAPTAGPRRRGPRPRRGPG